MQAEDRKAFDTILAEIFGAIDKPFTEAAREGFWKGLRRMSIIEFSRCRDLLFEDLEGGERPRNFSVANVWALKSKLRAAAPTQSGDDWQGDDWDVKANLRLLARLMPLAMKRVVTPAETRSMVAMKNHWAEVMRKCGSFEDVPLADQNASWTLCMQEAEAMQRDAA